MIFMVATRSRRSGLRSLLAAADAVANATVKLMDAKSLEPVTSGLARLNKTGYDPVVPVFPAMA